MKDIKQKGSAYKALKSVDKTTISGVRMKDNFLKIKDKSEDVCFSESNSPTEYATDSISHYTNYTKDKVIHKADKIGRQSINKTRENICEGVEKIREVKADRLKHVEENTDFVTTKGKDNLKKRFKKPSHQKIKTIKKIDKTIKSTAKGTIKTADKTIKTANTSIKTSQQSVKTAHAIAKASEKAAKLSIQSAKAAAKATATTAKETAKVTVVAVKAIIASAKGLISMIAAGGWIAVVVILIICLIGLIVSSIYGIFFSDDPVDDTAIPITQVVADLNAEFYDQIELLEFQYSPDIVSVVGSDGESSISWEEILSIFTVKTATDETDGMFIAQISETEKDIIRNIMNDMHSVSHAVETTEKEITIEDEDGKEITVIVEETILNVTITHKSYTDMMDIYLFNTWQKEQVELLLNDDNRILWAQFLGGFISSSGQVIISSSDFIPIGRFSYSLPSTFTITSLFGYREDPFTGELSYHSGLDIAAPEKTQILAADSGTVVVANATDSWGGGCGYYVVIEHSDGYKTLYAHCYGISVVSGQQVQKGEVIGYVGTTGNSTGNHLHFEVIKDDECVDPLDFFIQ